jgi:uncharacterized protein YecE (DUF72 family)
VIAAEADVAIAYLDEEGAPAIDAPGSGFAYARLKGTVEGEPAGYPPEALDRWAALARRWAADGREVFIFMIGGFKARAPAAAEALIARLGEP